MPLVLGHLARYAETRAPAQHCSHSSAFTAGCRATTISNSGASPMDGATFSITLPSEMRMLSVARNFIEAACEAYRLDRQTTNALMIVTGEAITNIVRHAHQNR